MAKLIKKDGVDTFIVLIESVINCAVVPANCAVDKLFVLNSPVVIFLNMISPADIFVTVKDCVDSTPIACMRPVDRKSVFTVESVVFSAIKDAVVIKFVFSV